MKEFTFLSTTVGGVSDSYGWGRNEIFLYLEYESYFIGSAVWVVNDARELGRKKCDRRQYPVYNIF